MNSAWDKKTQQRERSDPRFKAPPPSNKWWRQETKTREQRDAATKERKARETREIHNPPKTT